MTIPSEEGAKLVCEKNKFELVLVLIKFEHTTGSRNGEGTNNFYKGGK